MSSRITRSPIEKIGHLRDEILQQFFFLQMTSTYGNNWKNEVKIKVDSHFVPSSQNGGQSNNNNQQNNRGQRGQNGRNNRGRTPSTPPQSTYSTIHNKIATRGISSIQITDFDTTLLVALITFDFHSDFTLDGFCSGYVSDIRAARNSRNHFANPADVLADRSFAADTLVKLKDLLIYLKAAWGHNNASSFADNYLEEVATLDAELFNEEIDK